MISVCFIPDFNKNQGFPRLSITYKTLTDSMYIFRQIMPSSSGVIGIESNCLPTHESNVIPEDGTISRNESVK
jgi:hypothetical protein